MSAIEDEEALLRAVEERAAIVAKYDKGREKGAVIDSWEDPALEIYHVMDRYGFIHDQRLPSKDLNELKAKEVEAERAKKWLKMLSDWKNYYHARGHGDKLKRRLYKGVPEKLRGVVWQRLLDIQRTRDEQHGKYDDMKDLGRKYSPDIRQIDLDVNRTYRNHSMFRERYGIKQQELFHVLAAYSVYNSEVGYCQGMSQIAALLLMYMNEEDAFWALSNLMVDKRFRLHGFFIPGFPKLMRFQQHHEKILTKLLPKLKKHLDKNGIDAGIYTLKWFFQCFLDRVPFSLTLRLWDIYLYEGEKLLLAMGYNILKMHRRVLSQMGMEEMLEFIQIRVEKDFGYPDDAVIESLEKCMEELKKNKLEYPAPAPPTELPQKPFGLFTPPPLEALLGRRKEEFSEEELAVNAAILRRIEEAKQRRQGSHLSIDNEPSVDDVSSAPGRRSSRSSLDGTSATSAADLSAFSVYSSQAEHLSPRSEADVEGDLSDSHPGSVLSLDKDGVSPSRTLGYNQRSLAHATPTNSPKHVQNWEKKRSEMVEKVATHHLSYCDNVDTPLADAAPPFPTTPTSPGLATPTPPVFTNIMPPLMVEKTTHFRSEVRTTKRTETRYSYHQGGSPSHQQDKVRIYVPYTENPAAINGGSPSPSPVASSPLPVPRVNGTKSVSPPPTDPNRVVIRVDLRQQLQIEKKKRDSDSSVGTHL